MSDHVSSATDAAVAAGVSGSLPLMKFFAAFIFVIALMLGLAWLVKRAGLAGPLLRHGQKRRLSIVESLPVDHRRKLALVRCDGEEHLLLLGPEHALVVKTGLGAPATLPPAEEETRRALS